LGTSKPSASGPFGFEVCCFPVKIEGGLGGLDPRHCNCGRLIKQYPPRRGEWPMSAPCQQAAVDNLFRRISSLLRGSLGASPIPDWLTLPLRTPSPIIHGLCAGLLYAILFCGAPWLVHKPNWSLFFVSAWGSVYFAFAVTIAMATSSSVLKIIESKVLPALSERAASAMDEDLTRRFGAMRVSVVSYSCALIATAASVVAIRRDVPSAPWAEIAYWGLGFSLLYLTAARTTDVARFYGTIADHVKIDADRLYALDPARSVLITQIATVGRRVLLFWFGILCSVVTLFIFFRYSDLFWFVLLVVPTASFFSLGVGTIVFLNSERDIRHVVNEVAASTLRTTEREIADLFNRRDELDQAARDRLKELMSLHEKLAATGWYRSYRSALFSVLSILAPFAGPIVSILLWALSRPIPAPK